MDKKIDRIKKDKNISSIIDIYSSLLYNVFCNEHMIKKEKLVKI